ncbi:hypothetical protein SDC9_139048 [bioreactor metagenome]|uniref:Uncharacterized protein n=1 Tax=bioreactor metagenome TaxID=1076179 RepID=A0A645DR26_9ZZZZ
MLLFQCLFPVIGVFVGRDAHDFETFGAICFVYTFEVGYFVAAWFAPAGPKIYQHIFLAFQQLRQGAVVALTILYRECRGCFAGKAFGIELFVYQLAVKTVLCLIGELVPPHFLLFGKVAHLVQHKEGTPPCGGVVQYHVGHNNTYRVKK